jgi:hypothetical protein
VIARRERPPECRRYGLICSPSSSHSLGSAQLQLSSARPNKVANRMSRRPALCFSSAHCMSCFQDIAGCVDYYKRLVSFFHSARSLLLSLLDIYSSRLARNVCASLPSPLCASRLQNKQKQTPSKATPCRGTDGYRSNQCKILRHHQRLCKRIKELQGDPPWGGKVFFCSLSLLCESISRARSQTRVCCERPSRFVAIWWITPVETPKSPHF